MESVRTQTPVALRFGIALIALAILALPRPAQATLGAGSASIETDRQAFSAVHKVLPTTSAKYTIHALELGATEVREYVSADDQVFAITWTGVAHPDLSKLLGQYHAEYFAALKRHVRPRGYRGSVKIATARLTVAKWGHMRHLQGRALAPALLPSGVGLNEIQ